SNPELSQRPVFTEAAGLVTAPGSGRTSPTSPLIVQAGAPRVVAPAVSPSNATAGTAVPPQANAPADKAQTQQSYGRLPLSFEANSGQTDSQVRCLTRSGGVTTFLTPTEAVMVLAKNSESGIQNSEFELQNPESSPPAADRNLGSAVVRMQWVGANPNPVVM